MEQDMSKARGFLSELNTKYPTSDLTLSARILCGEKISQELSKDPSQPTTMPSAMEMSPAYPNPFNPSTTIRFALASDGQVKLVVYDILGREVARLAEGYRQSGYHKVTWNGQNACSGLYFARLTIANEAGKVIYSKTHKLLLTR
jgi:hypothetical protein